MPLHPNVISQFLRKVAEYSMKEKLSKEQYEKLTWIYKIFMNKIVKKREDMQIHLEKLNQHHQEIINKQIEFQ